MKLNNSELINLWQFSLGDKEKEILGDILFTERIDINDNKMHYHHTIFSPRFKIHI